MVDLKLDYDTIYSKYLNDGKGDNTYRKAEFHESRPETNLLEELMSVNERLVGLLAVIGNVLVVLVFVRVLGLTRLASRLIVSIACSNIFGGAAIIIHSLAVTYISLSNSPLKCRLLYLAERTSNWVKWSSLACAVLERIIAINMPSQYMASMVVMAPTLVAAPWIYWMFRMISGFVLSHILFEDDMGCICQHHMMSTILDDPMEVIPKPAVIVLVTLTLLLVITITLHPPHYDNIWEANRLKLEYKTCNMIFQLLAPTYLLSLPGVIVSSFVRLENLDTYTLLLIKHACFQIAIYSDIVLFLVMMKRREFRKAFRLIFASKEAIRQARLPNYLLVATETSHRTRSISLAESLSFEPRAPVAVAARDDYRSLITETDMVTMTLKKKGKASLSDLFRTA